MESRDDRLEKKIDVLAEDVVDIKVKTAENTQSLTEHMRRTAAVEDTNELLRQIIVTTKEDMDKRFTPLEVFMDRVKFSFVLVSTLTSVVLILKELGVFSG